MSLNALEAALNEPDNNASQLQLHDLICTPKQISSSTTATATQFLHAFCSRRLHSTVRRRWVGLGLIRMMDASATITHLKAVPHNLQQLGGIILNQQECEEIKIVAGLVIRKGVARGIGFETFWSTDTVPYSGANFPTEPNSQWMQRFQGFLDTLGDLAIANLATDPAILYPVALVASDGFQWRDASDVVPVAIVQERHLTLIIPDSHLREICFVDIPLSHINSMRHQQSLLHDSQGRGTEHKPWDLVLELRSRSATYFINSVGHNGDSFTILLGGISDAEECEQSIREIQKGMTKASKSLKSQFSMSSSDAINVGRQKSPSESDGMKPPTNPSVSKPARLSGVNRTLQGTTSKSEDIQTESSQPPPRKSNETWVSSHGSSQQEIDLVSPTKSDSASKGKLPKIGQTTTRVLKRQSQTQVDVYSIPGERNTKRSIEQADSESASGRSEQSKRTKRTHTGKAPRTRGKAYEDDDEEYKPGKPVARKKPSSKRKSGPEDEANEEQPKKKRDTKQMTHPGPSKAGNSNKTQTKAKGLIGTLRSSQVSSNASATQQQRSTPHTVRSPSTPHSQKRVIPDPVADLQRSTTPVVLPKQKVLVTSSPPAFVNVHDVDFDEPTLVHSDSNILSSNSKPLPASPHAESTAISGHVDSRHVDIAQELSNLQRAKNDPFKQRREGQKVTSFLRRLTGEGLSQSSQHDTRTGSDGHGLHYAERSTSTMIAKPMVEAKSAQSNAPNPTTARIVVPHSPTSGFNRPKSQPSPSEMQDVKPLPRQLVSKMQPIVQQGLLDLEGDTLLEDFRIHTANIPNDSPLRFDTNSHASSSSSSRSSTSAEPESDPPVPTSEAEEQEWEYHLQKHQRNLHDQLMNVTRRVLRHIVDNETAVSHVVEKFATDSEHMVQALLEKQDGQFASLFGDLETKKTGLTNEFECMAGQLARERKMFK